MYQTIISAEELSTNLPEHNWLVIDCRYDLADKEAGFNSYLDSHITGALYASVHSDLSGEPLTDHGRHPLPSAERLTSVFSAFGIDGNKQVVVYDASSGAFAARLWWLLRYMGHEAVAVLDGGWQAWQGANLAIRGGEEPENSPAVFSGQARQDWLVTLDDVQASSLLVDSRDGERYRGEVEPIDPLAGHIPGAINHCWKQNLAENGHFLGSRQLQRQFEQIYTDTPAEQVVFYCGSGVTACHNILASTHAGLAPARLYAGSWSEWCSQPGCQVATGAEPA